MDRAHFDKEISQMTLKLEPTDVNVFQGAAGSNIAYQDKFESQWLNVIQCKNPRFKLWNQQLSIAIALCLGSKVCKKNVGAFAEKM